MTQWPRILNGNSTGRLVNSEHTGTQSYNAVRFLKGLCEFQLLFLRTEQTGPQCSISMPIKVPVLELQSCEHAQNESLSRSGFLGATVLCGVREHQAPMLAPDRQNKTRRQLKSTKHIIVPGHYTLSAPKRNCMLSSPNLAIGCLSSDFRLIY